MERAEPHRGLIIAISILIPIVVASLFAIKINGLDFSMLPPVYATINGVTAILLIVAYRAIRHGNRTLHERLMKANILLSTAFLVMYVLYHMTTDPTPFGGTGAIRYIYFFILITHILLSAALVPLVLFTYVRARVGNFARHKKLAKFTWPIWLYVTVTGVVVYIMISPYYK